MSWNASLEQSLGNPADSKPCTFCGTEHQGRLCPLIKSIEFFEDGKMKRIEFYDRSDRVERPARVDASDRPV
jgi:hypothetical protein